MAEEPGNDSAGPSGEGVAMTSDARKRLKTIIDLEMLNTYNAEGCPACGRKFNLGDPVVLACGDWQGGPRYVHENEAVFDAASATYVERSCHEANRAG